jgi:tRNA threonylcarbamoyladenosine biosynthesis protein TsaE
MVSMEKGIANLEALEKEAFALAKTLSARKDRAFLITLSGELGAGKTAFVKALGKALGITTHITSPTFVLLKSYPLSSQAFKQLVHIDAYRLSGKDELIPLSFSTYLTNPENLIVLEWPERVVGALPTPDIALTLSVSLGEGRTLSYA